MGSYKIAIRQGGKYEKSFIVVKRCYYTFCRMQVEVLLITIRHSVPKLEVSTDNSLSDRADDRAE